MNIVRPNRKIEIGWMGVERTGNPNGSMMNNQPMNEWTHRTLPLLPPSYSTFRRPSDIKHKREPYRHISISVNIKEGIIGMRRMNDNSHSFWLCFYLFCFLLFLLTRMLYCVLSRSCMGWHDVVWCGVVCYIIYDVCDVYDTYDMARRYDAVPLLPKSGLNKSSK